MNQFLFYAVFVSLLLGAPAEAERPTNRVLVIGMDGVRPDALRVADTPALDALIADGSSTESTRILGDRYRKSDTVSGPGWSSFLTGVWADKHGVNDNSFKNKNYTEFPHFFSRLKQCFPGAVTGSFVDWAPIDEHIVSDADVRKVYPSEGADGYTLHDKKVTADACEFLSEGDPHAVVVYLGAIDETGHRDGFHPSVRSYVSAIETVDKQVGRLIESLRARPGYDDENWLVVISTDHGGRGTGHGGGHDVPEINTTFMIVSGQAASRGNIDQQTYVVDVAATALVHLGVELKPEWKIDGRPVGLK